MGEMAPVREVHAQNRVARLELRKVHLHVGLRARVGLHVRMVGPEQRPGAVDRKLLDDVDVLASAIVALAGVSLGVLVRQHRTLGVENRAADGVLGRNELEIVLLALRFESHGLCDRGIRFGQRGPRQTHFL